MNVLALCSGIGGLELGVKLANPRARCVCWVEKDPFCQSVLLARMREGCLDDAPLWDDLLTFDGRPWRGRVDCLTAGYPCQPFSTAGHMRGEADERHLWHHVRRIVGETESTICFFENVSNHLRMGFEQVHDDLRSMGYRVAAGLFTAEEVGAKHKRERLFILAHSSARGNRLPRTRPEVGGEWLQATDEQDGQQGPRSVQAERFDVRRAITGGCPRVGGLVFPPAPDDHESWREVLPKPVVLGGDDGPASRLDRMSRCGNAVVPLVAAHAWRVLEDCLSMA